MSVAYIHSPTPHHLLPSFPTLISNSSPSLLSTSLSSTSSLHNPHLSSSSTTAPSTATSTSASHDSGGIALTSETVHSTWSEFTKKKNSRAELTRLENISWRIWHALRLTTHKPQPRFAVKVDKATSCLVDPHAKPTAPVSKKPPPFLHAPFRSRKQSLQVDPRRFTAAVAPLSTSTPTFKSAGTSLRSYTASRPFVVIELPSNIYEPKPSPRPTIKRVQRHADLSNFFTRGDRSSVRMLTGPAARAAIMSKSADSPPGSPAAVVFFMGSESDNDCEDGVAGFDLGSTRSRASLDECRPTYFL